VTLMAFVFGEVVPLPIAEETLNPPAIFQTYEAAANTIEATAASADDPKLLDLSLKLFDNDAGRRASIDARAGAMMSAITLAATLVTGVGFTTFKDTSSLSSAAFWAMFLTFVLALGFLTVTTVLLFQIQGAVARSTPDPRDVVTPPPVTPSDYPRQVAVIVLRYTIANYKVNNRVVNRLWIAQKCFRNALLVLVVGGIVTTVLMMLTAPNAAGGLRLAQALAVEAGCTDLPSLAVDRNGRWRGTCVRNGRPAGVVIHPDGRSEFPP
jgi:hypothetical protein